MSLSDKELFQKIVELLEDRERIALCIIVEKKGSGPRDVGAKMIVCSDGRTIGTIGGGILERMIVQEALKIIEENRSREITFSLGGEEGIETGLMCGGSIKIFIDVLNPKPRLIIIGSGSIAKPLAEVASIVGFEILIVDSNGKTATRDRFPMASRIILRESLVKGVIEAELRKNDFVAIVHGNIKDEYEVLKEVLKLKPKYIGLLGSRRKSLEFKKKLIEDGFKVEDVEKIYSPIGLDIKAETPEEIAISIMAEVIMVLRGKN